MVEEQEDGGLREVLLHLAALLNISSDAATTYLKVCSAGEYSAAGQSSCTNALGEY